MTTKPAGTESELERVKRVETAITNEMMVLRCVKRDAVVEAETARWWAARACGTRDHGVALEASNGAAKSAWRCEILYGTARATYEVLRELLGGLQLGDAGALELEHAKALGELVKLKLELANKEAQRALEAARAIATEKYARPAVRA